MFIAWDLSELVSYIPFAVMFLVAVLMVLAVRNGGLVQTALVIDNTEQVDYRRSAVLENMLSVDANRSELEATIGSSSGLNAYSYPQRRSVLPVEFFTHEDTDSSPKEIGYKKTSGGHCFIDRVNGLDGQNFAFYIDPLDDPGRNANDPRTLQCTDEQNQGKAVYSSALLVRKAKDNPRLPVRIYVYER